MKTLKLLAIATLITGADAVASPVASNLVINHYVLLTELTAEDIAAYLKDRGYEVLTTPRLLEDGTTWQCETRKNGVRYLATVYTDGENVVGFEDTAID